MCFPFIFYPEIIMDNTTTQALSLIALITSFGGALITWLNRTRIVSTCCGKKITASFIIDHNASTPDEAPPPILIPNKATATVVRDPTLPNQVV